MNENMVKSFEIADDGEMGDIVSMHRKKSRKKLRVGLLPLSWFEWWPMFPESGMKEKIQQDGDVFVQRMQEKFGETYDLVIPEEYIDTLNKAYDVGVYFREQNIDLLIIDEATYITDFIPIQTIELLPNIPLILFATQATDNLWSEMRNTDIIRYEGLVGTTQLAGAFTKMGRKYHVVVGSLEDDEAFEELGMHMQVAQLVQDLKYADIGLIGHTFRGMYDIEVDKTKIKGAFGPNVLYLDVSHLVQIWKALQPEEIAVYRNEVLTELPQTIEGIDEEDINKSVSLGLAVCKLIDRFGLECMTLLGQHHVEVNTRTSADFSFYCAERQGCVTSHEGDLANLVVKLVLKQLSGTMPIFLEWSAFDRKSDTLLLTHHGVIDPNLNATDMNACRITPSPEKWDFTGNGMSLEFCGKAGEATLSCLLDGKDGWKLLISKGECVEMPCAPCYAPQFHFKHECLLVKEYVKRIIQEGVAHHVCLAYGDHTAALKLFAAYENIHIVEI